jgi:hypothetical protein
MLLQQEDGKDSRAGLRYYTDQRAAHLGRAGIEPESDLFPIGGRSEGAARAAPSFFFNHRLLTATSAAGRIAFRHIANHSRRADFEDRAMENVIS